MVASSPDIFDPDPLDVALGMAVRLRRRRTGMSQSDLGDAIGVSFQQVQKYERGANRISFSTLVRLAAALDCQVADLVGEVEQLGGGRAGLDQALVQPETAPLLDAFAEIRSPAVRRAILELVRRLALDGEDPAQRL